VYGSANLVDQEPPGALPKDSAVDKPPEDRGHPPPCSGWHGRRGRGRGRDAGFDSSSPGPTSSTGRRAPSRV